MKVILGIVALATVFAIGLFIAPRNNPTNTNEVITTETEFDVDKEMQTYQSVHVPNLIEAADNYYGTPESEREDTAGYELDKAANKQGTSYDLIRFADKTPEQEELWEQIKLRTNAEVITIKSKLWSDTIE